MKKLIILATAAVSTMCAANAQINSPESAGFIDRAVMMYADGNYNGCIDQLTNIDDRALSVQQREMAEYYRAAAYVHTDKPLAIIMLQRFMSEYPQSALLPQARLSLADCYYGTDYKKALEIYESINDSDLPGTLYDDLHYRMAYSLIETGRYPEAEPLLAGLSDSDKYHNAALFYRGYVAYTNRDYKKAERLFRMVNPETAPGNMSEFYLSQMYYMKGDYERALSMAKQLMKRRGLEPHFIAEANRIAGESAYHLGQHSQAVKFLDAYVEETDAPVPSALYILGVDAYDNGDYSKAENLLAPVTEIDNAMGQAANLYIGQAYLHDQDYDAAAMAFNRALNMDYDAEARETAYYNYAVTSTKGGAAPFASTMTTFSRFLSLYPESRYAPEVQKHIVTSYITDSNYAAALESINKMQHPTAETLAAKQRVLYSLGLQALSASDYNQALTYLGEARALKKYDASLDTEVALSLGEAYIHLGEYGKAVSELEAYLSKAPKTAVNRPLANYDLGYAYFGEKNYKKAETNFSRAISAKSSLPTAVRADAYNRLGDSQYAQKSFAEAMKSYDTAYKTSPETGDYSLYQKARMAGFQRNHRQKIEILADMRKSFPASPLIPDAMLETTEGYLQMGNNDKAIEVYRQLVKEFPKTAQGRQGYLQMALVQLNTGSRSDAIKTYKEVIRRYPSSEEAVQAVEQMKRISAEDGTLNQFMDFLSGIAGAPVVDTTELDQLVFDTAEKAYLEEGDTDRLKKFIKDYDQSPRRARALSYLMESSANSGSDTDAYSYAVEIVEKYPSSSYAQDALSVKAEIEEEQGRGNLAIKTWQQLANTASSAEMLLRARMGIVRNGLSAKDYSTVIETADAVLATAGIGENEKAEASYSKGRALAEKGKAKDARNTWKNVAGNTGNIHGIMSAYEMGQSFYDEKDYTKAEEWAKKVANSDSPHIYWTARGFILLSDIYMAQGDKYKARQYLQAVRDNYTGTEKDIFEMIDNRLK